jgi:hypothetical protein
MIGEELAELGFFDEVEPRHHQTICSSLMEFLKSISSIKPVIKMMSLIAKIAELLEDDALVYSPLVHPILGFFAQSLSDPTADKILVGQRI